MATLNKRKTKKSAVKKPTSKVKSSSKKRNELIHSNSTIDYNYIKGVDFRSVHVDGAIGGLTTKGYLHMAVFTERNPIPRKTTFNVSPNGILGDEIVDKRESKSGIIRQMEVDLVMNEATAADLRNWLDARLGEIQERKKLLAELKKKGNKE